MTARITQLDIFTDNCGHSQQAQGGDEREMENSTEQMWDCNIKKWSCLTLPTFNLAIVLQKPECAHHCEWTERCLELTGGSCAIPTHVWASLGGSPLFPGSSHAVGTAAGLCSRGRSHSDDTQTWREGKQEECEPSLPSVSWLQPEVTECTAEIDSYHLFVCGTFTSHHASPHTSLHIKLLLLHSDQFTWRWFTVEGTEVVSGLASGVSEFASGILFLSFRSFYLAKWLLRSEERISGGCQVCVQPLCHSAAASKWD